MGASAWRKTPPNSGGRLGFTLLEVLIAFAIFSLTLAAITGAFSMGLQSLRAAEGTERAVLRAQSTLAGVGLAVPIEETMLTGDYGDRMTWQIRIAPHDQSTADDPGATGLALFDVWIDVIQADGRRVALHSLRRQTPP